jgi:hypothetical protein
MTYPLHRLFMPAESPPSPPSRRKSRRLASWGRKVAIDLVLSLKLAGEAISSAWHKARGRVVDTPPDEQFPPLRSLVHDPYFRKGGAWLVSPRAPQEQPNADSKAGARPRRPSHD